MRELKLRAYYKGNTEIPAMMCDVVGFGKTSDHYDTFILNSLESIGIGRLAVPRFRIKCEESKCVVLRYTEFEDKNKNEIYECDILKCHDGLHGKYFIGIVKMQDGCWSIDFSHLPDGHRPFSYGIGWNREHDYLKMYHPVLGNSMEIIGDVFRNPELIVRAR